MKTSGAVPGWALSVIPSLVLLDGCGAGDAGRAVGCLHNPNPPPSCDFSIPNQAPTANAGLDQFADEGTTVNLVGTGTDADGTVTAYSWAQESGTFVTILNADQSSASFDAPIVATTEDLVFRLTVTDDDGATASDTVTITVNDVPACPVPELVTRITFPIVQEVEPNNDISTAFAVTVPIPEPGDVVGLEVLGAVHDGQDPVDTISFTSSRTMQFFFKLCAAACNQHSGNDNDGNPDSLDTSIAYFDVLDAAGIVLASTRTNVSTENFLELCIDGGVITYIMVIANDTMGGSQRYRVTAFEDRLD